MGRVPPADLPPLGPLPSVSLGVPVYNGGQQLETALEGLLAQDYPRLEILISDNASTDGTEALCRSVAARDPRVRYVRQKENLGAARNFEFVAYESKGNLFAWCAHDDIRKPGFVSACVEELQRHPTAVACNCIVEFLDEQGKIRPNWADRNFSTVGLTLPQRCLRLIDHMDWADIYGLIRREALERVMPIDPVWGSDVVFTMKLLMLGDLCKVERPLFQYRVRSRPKPPQQTMQEVVDANYRVTQPYTALVRDLLAVPLSAVTSAELREEIFLGFVRTYWELEPMRPHPCWRNILLREHEQELRGDVARPRFPLHLIRWLAEVVPGPTEGRRQRAFELVLRGARRAVVAASAAPDRDSLARAWTRALGQAFPRLAIHVLGPAASVRAWQETPGIASASSHATEPAALRALAPDLAFCALSRRRRGLDRLLTGCGAVLSFALGRPRLTGIKRRVFAPFKLHPADTLYTHLLSPDRTPEDLLGLLSRLEG